MLFVYVWNGFSAHYTHPASPRSFTPHFLLPPHAPNKDFRGSLGDFARRERRGGEEEGEGFIFIGRPHLREQEERRFSPSPLISYVLSLSLLLARRKLVIWAP